MPRRALARWDSMTGVKPAWERGNADAWSSARVRWRTGSWHQDDLGGGLTQGGAGMPTGARTGRPAGARGGGAIVKRKPFARVNERLR